MTIAEIRNHLADLLVEANMLKTGERSEAQRKLAILATKIEDATAWAAYSV